MIKGITNITDIKAGSTSIVKVMAGATTLWQKIVGDLLARFQARVASDGGTFVTNEKTDEIVEDDSLTLLLTPNAYKAGKLYSALPEDGSGDFTVDGGGTPTINTVDDISFIKVNDASTNQLTNSIDFNTGWNIFRVFPNTYTPPTLIPGVSNYFKVTENNTSSSHQFYKASSQHIIQNGLNTISIYAKAVERQYLGIVMGFSVYPMATFDVLNGTVVSSDSIYTSNIEPIVDGWYRCSVVFDTADIDENRLRFYLLDTSTRGTGSYTGVLNSGMYLAGPQINPGGVLTSYVPTDTTAVTVPAEDISVSVPAGTNAIYETSDNTLNKITTIPATYQLPIGNVNSVKMSKYSHNFIEWVPPTDNEVFDGEITTLEVDIN